MNCWFCSHIMSVTDITDERESTVPNKIRQTKYNCTNCGAEYVDSVHLIHGPLISEEALEKRKNIPNSERKNNVTKRPQNDI